MAVANKEDLIQELTQKLYNDDHHTWHGQKKATDRQLRYYEVKAEEIIEDSNTK